MFEKLSAALKQCLAAVRQPAGAPQGQRASGPDPQLHFQIDVAVEEPATPMLVVSPLTTLRFRQGQLIRTSPNDFGSIGIEETLLPLLAFLKTPRAEREWLEFAARLGLDIPKLQSLVKQLKDCTILETPSRAGQTPPPDSPEEHAPASPSQWWDKNDLARIDTRMHQIIQVLYGNTNTLRADFPLDAKHKPLPWFSYPAIEYLKTLDLSAAQIFEYGSGGSTLFFEDRCQTIVSIEQNPHWLQRLEAISSGKAHFKLRQTVGSYADSILEEETQYDLIVIDAIPEYRAACVSNSLARIAPGGIIILDDAPMYPQAYEALREIDACPMDFIGLAPLEDVVQTTSFFFNRNAGPPRIRKKMPTPLGSRGFDGKL
jgi:hypothetical protein